MSRTRSAAGTREGERRPRQSASGVVPPGRRQGHRRSVYWRTAVGSHRGGRLFTLAERGCSSGAWGPVGWGLRSPRSSQRLGARQLLSPAHRSEGLPPRPPRPELTLEEGAGSSLGTGSEPRSDGGRGPYPGSTPEHTVTWASSEAFPAAIQVCVVGSGPSPTPGLS